MKRNQAYYTSTSISAKLIFLIFTIFFSTSHAALIDLEFNSNEDSSISSTENDGWWLPFLKKENHSFFLYDENCENLKQHFDDLTQTSKKMKIPFDCLSTSYCKSLLTCHENNGPFLVKVNVTHLLDDYVKFNHLRQKSSVNCWNNVLLYLGYITQERFISAQTFHEFIEDENQCNPVKSSDEIGPGTVVAIRDKNELNFDPQGGGELHGFVLITKDLVFSKNGPAKKYPYELQPIERMWGVFSVGKNCRSLNPSPNCQVTASYFNCRKKN